MLITTSKTLKEVVDAIERGEKFYLNGSEIVLTTVSIKMNENGEFINSENLISLSVEVLEKELNAGNITTGKTSMQQQHGRMLRHFSGFNELSKKIHGDMVSVGWWDNTNQCLLEKLQMVSTEIAEATEGERKNLMDDKLPHRKMGEVELADTLIRVLDLGGKLGLTYCQTNHDFYVQMINKVKNAKSIASKHFVINYQLVSFFDCIDHEFSGPSVDLHYSVLIESIMEVGKFRGYDIIGALHEKCAYNRERADHKRENRAEKHGKKF